MFAVTRICGQKKTKLSTDRKWENKQWWDLNFEEERVVFNHFQKFPLLLTILKQVRESMTFIMNLVSVTNDGGANSPAYCHL